MALPIILLASRTCKSGTNATRKGTWFKGLKIRGVRIPPLLVAVVAYIVLAAACNVGLFEHSSLTTHAVTSP